MTVANSLVGYYDIQMKINSFPPGIAPGTHVRGASESCRCNDELLVPHVETST